MIIDKTYKLEKLTTGDDDDEGNSAMRYIHVTADGAAMACNGHALVKVPVEMQPGDVPGPITPDSLTYARKHTLGDFGALLILKDGASVVTEDSTDLPRSIESTAKIGESLQLELLRQAPESSQDDAAKWQRQLDASLKGAILVGLNPKLLAKIADAMGSGDGVILAILPPKTPDEGVTKPVAVHPVWGAAREKVRGVIMPVRAVV